MPPSRGIGLAGHGLNGLRSISRLPQMRLRSSRQLSSYSSQQLLLSSKNPRRSLRPSPSSVAPIGAATLTLWPWASKAPSESTPPAEFAAAHSPPTQPPTPSPTLSPTPDAAPEVPTPVESISIPQKGSIDDHASVFQQITLDKKNDIADLPDIPEQIGFLKELGIDYGSYGITPSLEWALEHIHVYAGTPWWASIALAAIAVRLFTMVPLGYSSNHSAKLRVISPYLKANEARVREAMNGGDTALQAQLRAELKGVKDAIGLKYSWVFAPMALQAVLGFCAFRLLRAMALLPVPGLETGGFLWMMDLTVSDPFFVIPAIMGGTMHLLARLGGESGVGPDASPNTAISQTMKNVMLYWMPIGFAGIISFQPAALQVSFLAAMLWGIGQSLLFRQIWFRKLFNMELLPSQVSTANPTAPEAEVGETSKIPPIHQRLKVVQPPRLKYQAPTKRGTPRETAPALKREDIVQPQKESIVDGILAKGSKSLKDGGKIFMTAVQEAREKAVASTGQAPAKKSSRSQKFTQSAEAYEKRRRLEREEEARSRRPGRP